MKNAVVNTKALVQTVQMCSDKLVVSTSTKQKNMHHHPMLFVAVKLNIKNLAL
jgi:hypothetical protein